MLYVPDNFACKTTETFFDYKVSVRYFYLFWAYFNAGKGENKIEHSSLNLICSGFSNLYDSKPVQ